jgi:hypothetical protein
MTLFRMVALMMAAAAMGVAADSPAQDDSAMAATVLAETGRARQAIVRHDRQAALEHAGNALAQAQKILNSVPKSTPRPLLVPVYRGSEKRGSLDVTTAADRLEAAQSLLERSHWVEADTALSAISDGLIRKGVEGQMPLFQARQYLMDARARVLEQKYEAAARPLRAAAREISAFEKLFPGPQAKDADAMRVEVEKYARLIATDHADALLKIDSWLRRIGEWNGKVGS